MSHSVSRVVAALRQLVVRPDVDDTDRALLGRFARDRDQRAFAEVVARHGPLVRGVCRRLLHDSTAAEDVFQATFLVLAKKAGGRWRASVGPWLYAVAVRLCRKARARRSAASVDPDTLLLLAAPDESPEARLEQEESRGVLEEELARLAESLRGPLVLCYLQGLTRDEAARQLGVSLAMLKRHLERGRRLLADRLTRRGVSLAAVLGVGLGAAPLAAGVAEQTAGAAVAFLQGGGATAPVALLLRETTVPAAGRWLLASVLLACCLGAGIVAAVLLPKGTTAAPAEPKPPDDRVPADPLPEGAVARFGSPRLQDFTIDRSATFSPDRKLLATGGANNPICVWDASTGELVRNHQVQGSVYDLRWRPDGKLAAVTFFGHDVFLMQEFTTDEKAAARMQARVEEELKTRERLQDRPGKDHLAHVFLSADGRKAVAVWKDPKKPVRRVALYPFTGGVSSLTATAERTIEVPGHGDGAWLSGDGKTLLVHLTGAGGARDRVAAFDLGAGGKTDRPAWEIAPPGGADHRPALCLSPDGRRVVVVFWDERVELWNGPAGKLLRELPKLSLYRLQCSNDWWGLEVSPDGKRLALVQRGPTGTMGGRILDLDSGKEVCQLAPRPMALARGVVRFSGDGKRLVQVGYGVVAVWDAETGADACPLPGHRGGVYSLAIGPDGKTVFSAGADLTVRAWDPATGKERWQASFTQEVRVRFVTPDAVVVQQDRSAGETELPAVRLDPATGKARPLPGKLGEAREDELLALLPNGKAVVSFDRRTPAFRVWSWPAGEPTRRVPLIPAKKGFHADCLGCAFTPDGREFVVLMRYSDPHQKEQKDHMPNPPFVERWDLAAGKLLDRAKSRHELNNPVLVPSRDRLLALEKSQLWDVLSGQHVLTLSFNESTGHSVAGASLAALAPDQRTLAVCDGWSDAVWLFEMRSGRCRGMLSAEGRSQRQLSFLPDGRLVTAGATALVWDVGLRHAAAAVRRGGTDLAELWTALADTNTDKAWRAMAWLAASGDAVAFVRQRVRPVPRGTEAGLDRIFRGLNANRFADREAASKELDALGAAAVVRVKARLKTGVSEEVKARIGRYLAKYDRPGPHADELRSCRAVEVLEAIGTEAAKDLLKELARGDDVAPLTREALEALRRLDP